MIDTLRSARCQVNDYILVITHKLYKPGRRFFAEFVFAAILVSSTVAGWIRVTRQEPRYRKFYHQLARIGSQQDKLQGQVSKWMIEQLSPILTRGATIRLVIDDSPTKRYGPKVEGAGYHHNPNGKNRTETCYGHSWVVLSLLVEHPQWGTISLPLANMLYIRKCDLDKIEKNKRPAFRTKLAMLIELVTMALPMLSPLGKPIELLFDRGYISQEIFTAMRKMNVRIVTRFKSNANLFRLPQINKKKKRGRGRPRKYGDSIKRDDIVGDGRRKTKRVKVQLYGREVLVDYKTMILTSHISKGEPIRVVFSRIVEHSCSCQGTISERCGKWGTFVSTDTTMTPEEILISYSYRFSIEEMFKDLKMVCGLGRQQVRNLWSNLACFNLVLIAYTIVELWAWDKPEALLKQNRPEWDDYTRRPSHQNKRQLLIREIRWNDFSAKYAKTINQKLLEQIKLSLFDTIDKI